MEIEVSVVLSNLEKVARNATGTKTTGKREPERGDGERRKLWGPNTTEVEVP